MAPSYQMALAPKKMNAPILDGDVSESQAKVFEKAFKNAAKRLTGDCLKLFGANAVSTMGNATWNEGIITDSRSPNGIIPNIVAAVTDPGTQTVTINVMGGFASRVQTFLGGTFDMLAPLQQLVPSANITDLRAFILLHELGHLAGVLGADRDDPALSDAFNKKIAVDCFK
jgi:hypothetical protein